jgi:hypothetical protein
MADQRGLPKDKTNQMTRKSSLKLLVDVLMIISVLLAIANKLTENRMHELGGMVLFLLLVIHSALNLKWYGTILKPGYTVRRMLNLTVNMLLILTTATLLGSSIVISKTVCSFHGIETDLTLRQIHTTAAYWLFVLMSVHLGVHWTSFSASFKRVLPAGYSIRLPLALKLWLSMMALLYGALAAFEMDIFSKLFMIYAFDFWNFEQSAAKFFLNYLAIIAAFVTITHNDLKSVNCGRVVRKLLNSAAALLIK